MTARLRSSGGGVCVLAPAEEQWPVEGGAVLHWIRSTGARRPHDLVIAAAVPPRSPSPLAAVSPPGWRVLRRCEPFLKRAEAALRRFTGRRPPPDPGWHYPWLWVASALLLVRRFPVVHVHNRPDYTRFLRRLGYRGTVVLHMHNDLTEHVRAGSPRHASLLADVDAFVFCSDFLRRRATERLRLTSTHVVQNGTDLPSSTSRGRDLHHLVLAGRLVEEKGVLEAIEVCRRLRARGPFHLTVMGSSSGSATGPASDYERRVRDLAAQVDAEHGPGTVEILGHVPRSRMVTVMQEAGVLLHTCRWDEPFGMVLVEAMACGLPVVAVDRGGIPEVVVDGSTGFLVGADGADHAERVLELQDPQTHRSFSDAGLRRVEQHYTWDAVAEQWQRVLDSLPEAPPTRAGRRRRETPAGGVRQP